MSTREQVVEIARSWIKTPYKTNAMVKGAGVDCAMLLVGVYREAEMIPPDFDPRPYAGDFYLHSSEERYRNLVARFGHETPGPPQAGDAVLFRVGRAYAHGGVVTAWPCIVHARAPTPVWEEDVSLDSFGKHALWNAPKIFFTMW